MAKRPIFIPIENFPFYQEELIEFKWEKGFSKIVARRNIQNLHIAAQTQLQIMAPENNTNGPLLEISSKSIINLGRILSAFELKILLNDLKIPVECAFQGSKVFEKGGPYQDLYHKSAREAKKDPRIRNSGNIIGFKLLNQEFPSEPKTAFYDWLYINALSQQNETIQNALLNYKGFTDIAFNPQKSLNCQARSAAIFVGLKKSGYLEEALKSFENFVNFVYPKKPANFPTRNPKHEKNRQNANTHPTLFN